MSLIAQGSQPASDSSALSAVRKQEKIKKISSASSPWFWRLFFLVFVILFYCIEILWIKPVMGVNDDWGIYSTLSGAYLGYPDAHVLFFLYPLSWLLSKLYTICSFIPWYGLFMHGVQVSALYVIYQRSMHIWNRHGCTDKFWKPALTILCILFLIVDLNVISEVQYTTTAGLAAAAAIFCFVTTASGNSVGSFLLNNIPSFILAWISYSVRQNVFYLMLPMAGMLWLSKWINAKRNYYEGVARKMIGFALILAAGMGILYGLHMTAYSAQEWKDFKQINHYRERVGDFYTWPEYEECSEELTDLGITEEEYTYRRSAAPYVGYGMSVEDWKQMHDIAKKCYLARTNLSDRIKNIVSGGILVFFYQDGMQPANILALLLMAVTLVLILLHRNHSALFVLALYFVGRTVSWAYVLYGGRFPKRIVQPLITVDYIVLFGILLGFNLLRPENPKRYSVILPIVLLLGIVSLTITHKNVNDNYLSHRKTWDALKTYCHDRPEHLYVWPHNAGIIDHYCESPFDMTLDTYNNFVFTNWGVILNPNSKTKLSQYGVENFGQDVIDSNNTYFILPENPFNKENSVIIYFRHTYDVDIETVDTFIAGDTTYMVYQLR